MKQEARNDWFLAQQRFQNGDYSGARASALAVLAKQPASPAAHWMLGSAELELGNFRSAIKHSLSASSPVPQAAQQAIAVSRLLISTGETHRSYEVLSELLSAREVEKEILIAIGEQLLYLERYREALAVIEKAASLGAKHPMLSFIASNAHKFVGNLGQAIDSALDTIAQQPNFAHAFWSLAQMNVAEGRSTRISQMLRSLNNFPEPGMNPGRKEGFNLATRSVFFYSLYKEHENDGEYESAWRNLTEAMRLRRRLARYEASKDDEIFRELAKTITSPRQGSDIDIAEIPIFVVGMPRTGTTLVSRILGNHHNVASCGELNELNLATKAKADYFNPEFMNLALARRLSIVDTDGLGTTYLAKIKWRIEGKSWFIDKHQSNYFFVGLIHKHLPGAKVIHVTRSAIDSCFSNLKELFSPNTYTYSYDMKDVSHYYKNYASFMSLAGSELDNILTVKYEDIVSNPRAQSERMLRFCGLTDIEGVEDIEKNFIPVATASSVQVREGIHDRNIDGWRRYERQLAPLVDELDRT